MAAPSSAIADRSLMDDATALQKLSTSPSTWVTLCGAKVLRPPMWVPAKGVVHFIGDCFVGAAPQCFYDRFLRSLAQRGLWVIATPLSTSFDQQRLAEEAADSFERAYRALSGRLVEAKLPVYGMGHAMGARIAVQLGCGAAEAVSSVYMPRLRGQVFISYSAQSVSESVPCWREFFTRDEMRPLLRSISERLTRAGEFAEPMIGTALDLGSFVTRSVGLEGGAQIIGGKDRLEELYNPVLGQIPKLFGDIADGIGDFKPDDRELAKRVPREYPKDMPVLLLSFQGDSADQTRQFEKLLRKGRRSADGIELIELQGGREVPTFNEHPDILHGTDALNRAALSTEGLFDSGLLKAGSKQDALVDAIDRFVAPAPEDTKTAPKLPRVYLEGLKSSDIRHPLDLRQTRALSRVPGIGVAARQVVSALGGQIYKDSITSSILVGEQQYPWLHDVLHGACDILDISEDRRPQVYVKQSHEPAAYTLIAEGKQPFIVVHTALIEMLCEEEVEAVLAHELGHLKCDHGTWLSIANAAHMGASSLPLPARILQPFIDGFQGELYKWQRAAELTCDRAALLVSQEPWIPLSVIVKLSGGGATNMSRRPLPREQLEAFLDQAKMYEEAKGEGNLFGAIVGSLFGKGSSMHPLPVLRARELRRWADSADFRRVLSDHGQAPLPPP